MPEALARTGICEETIRCGLTDEAAASNQTQEVNIVYRKVDTNLNFVDREKEVEKFWKDNKIFEKSMDSRKEGETYTFYDGPPTANGTRSDTSYQGYDPEIPYNEGVHGSEKSRMGYSRTSG